VPEARSTMRPRPLNDRSTRGEQCPRRSDSPCGSKRRATRTFNSTWDIWASARRARRACAGVLHHRQDLQRADHAIARRRLVQTQDMAGCLAAERSAHLLQHGEHMAIADLGAANAMPSSASDCSSRGAHHRADHRTLENAGIAARAREHEQELVAIHAAPQGIHQHDGHPSPSSANPTCARHSRHGELQQLRVRGSASIVDVAAVR